MNTSVAARGVVVAFALFAALIIASMASSEVSADGQSPAKPAKLTVAAPPGLLNVNLDWNDVDGADRYWLRWRSVDRKEKLSRGVRIATSETTLALPNFGTWVVRVQACNDAGCSKPINKRFTVKPAPNRAPVIDAQTEQYGDFTKNRNAYPGMLVIKSLAGIFSDPDGDSLTYSASIPNSYQHLVNALVVMEAQQRLFFRADPEADWDAVQLPLTVTATLTATDPDGLSVSLDSPFLIVPWPNRAPVVDPQAEEYATFTENTNAPPGFIVSKSFAGIFSDPDGNALTYSASIPDSDQHLVNALSVDQDSQRLFFLADPEADWDALQLPVLITATLTATDPNGLSVSANAPFLVVPPPNRAPAINAQAEQFEDFTESINSPRGMLVSKSFAGIFSDPDGDPLTYSVTIPDSYQHLVNALKISDDLQRLFFRADAEADWDAVPSPLVITATLTATDPDGLSVSLSSPFLVSRGPNRAPVIDPQAEQYDTLTENTNAPRGTLVSKPYAGIFSDPNGDPLTMTVSIPDHVKDLVSALKISDDLQRLFFRADAEADWNAGLSPLVITVTLTATDPDGLSVSVNAPFLLLPPANRAPVIDTQAQDYTSFTGDTNAPVGVLVNKYYSGIFSDPDGDPLTFTVSIPEHLRGLASTLTIEEDQQVLFFQADPQADWDVDRFPLAITATLTATDPDGLSVSLSGRFMVVPNWNGGPPGS